MECSKKEYAYLLKAPSRNSQHVRFFFEFHHLREGPLKDLDRAYTMYEDGNATVIYARKMTRAYSGVKTNSSPRMTPL